MHLSLTANPSHLEAVNPVVLGKVRAKQAFDIRKELEGSLDKQAWPINKTRYEKRLREWNNR